MAGKFGVQHTQEVLTLAKVVALAVVKEVKKDGFQLLDLAAFLKSEAFEAALAPALEGIENVPQEMTEVDLFDGIKLGRFTYDVVQEVMEELKK